jgi:ABC-type multidrug transport system ATPase subunit/uncharacterized membrane protein YeiB
VLAINAAYFAAPVVSVVNPLAGPLSIAAGGAWSWALPYVGFEYKCIALFSMLFGASLLLVGGDGSDPISNRRLRRRLAALALFGLLHGVLLWFGDILLSYAVTGCLVMGARHWPVRRLFAAGLALFGVSLALLAAMAAMIAFMPPADLAAFATHNWSPPPAELATDIAAYRDGFASAFRTNLADWIEFQIQTLLLLTPRTAGLMLLGMALLRTGFLTGELATRRYLGWMAIGGLALAALGWNAWDMARQGFPLVRVQAIGTMITATLAPLVALGYAAGLILLLRARAATALTGALAAMGRMAFTNYLAQSLVMTSLFWGGRGLGLFGSISRPQLMLLVCILFTAQALLSVLWLRRVSHGPLELVWRRLSNATVPAPRLAVTGLVPAIATSALTRRIGARTVVSQVDLLVPQGAIYAFLGPNGAGKTTTIRMLLGLARPTAGSVRILGHDVVADRSAAAREVGALLEARATYDHLTGRENLDITRRLLGTRAGEVDRVLALVGLQAAAGRRVGHYSLGMRQRLGLARALIGNPGVLILDEPMNGLDPEGIAQMRATIRALPSEAGVTVFLSSHLLAEVEQVATHIGLLRDGRLIAQGPLPALLSAAPARLIVRTSDDRRGAAMLAAAGYQADCTEGGIIATGVSAAQAARTLVSAGLELHELTTRSTDLETLYHDLATAGAA